MKVSEIRELSTKEIVERIDTENEKLVRMRLNHAVTPLENPISIKDVRRNVARLKTELQSRMLTEKK
ncbi:MAG: 50S ribosomal protein L29 [Prolixibacteraceae bacterium]|nr:50S ribosomal protein L29 [Prolixibacteraceae bacterium]